MNFSGGAASRADARLGLKPGEYGNAFCDEYKITNALLSTLPSTNFTRSYSVLRYAYVHDIVIPVNGRNVIKSFTLNYD